jgi:hypothetical protein
MRGWTGLVTLAERQHGVFALWQAVHLGLSPRTVQACVTTRGWQRLHHGVYALPGSAATYSRRLMAARLAIGGESLVCGRGAAHAWGMTEARPFPVEIMVPEGCATTARKGIVVRRSRTLIPADRSFIGPLDLTSPVRSVIDMHRAGLEELTEVAATGVQLGLFSLLELRHRCDLLGICPGVRKMRAVIEGLGLDGKTDSTFERDVRRFLRANGIHPHPGIFDLVIDGFPIARLDMAFPAEQAFIDAEGFGWHSLPSAHRADRVRANDIHNLEWEPVYLTKTEFRETPERCLRQLRQALTRRAPGPTARPATFEG